MGQRTVDVAGGQTLRAGPHGQPGPARVLALHGQQALGDGHRVLGRRPGEQLCGEPLGDQPSQAEPDTATAWITAVSACTTCSTSPSARSG